MLDVDPAGGEPVRTDTYRHRAMPRPTTVFVCSELRRRDRRRWHGQCPGCGEWNTLGGGGPRGAGGRRGGRRRRRAAREARAAAEVEAPRCARLLTGIGELDRVLGGGLVPGSLVLLGGSPGIGKSTLTSMALGNLAAAGRRTLYVSGEESAAQIRLRAERLPGARARRAGARRDRPRHGAGDARRRAPRGLRDRLGADAARAGPDRGGGLRRPGARGRRPDHAAGQGARHRGAARRPRHEGGRAGRPARARAPRRLRAAVRGRARAHVPDAAGAEEPLRVDERGRRVRDATTAGSSRSRTRPRASSARRRARPGASCWPRWRARGRCSSRSRRSCRPSELVPPRRVANGIDRNRLALVLAVLARHAGVGAGDAPTCSSTSPAACASTSRGPTWRSRSRSRAPRAAWCWAIEAAARRASARSGSPASCARSAIADRRLAEAAKFGLATVITPTSGGSTATCRRGHAARGTAARACCRLRAPAAA